MHVPTCSRTINNNTIITMKAFLAVSPVLLDGIKWGSDHGDRDDGSQISWILYNIMLREIKFIRIKAEEQWKKCFSAESMIMMMGK